MAALPGMIKKTISTLPDAVVQPVDSSEVAGLIKLASEHKIPLVPRGGATSGFGGAVPAASGIVVDFVRMNRVLGIDPKAGTVEVEPGITWERLEEELKKKGLALRLYPSSAPGSTVGGWAAQGGSGIGSFEYGNFRENLTSVEIADPKGELKVLKGSDLDLVYGLEGITGLITKVKLRVRKADTDTPLLAAFPDSGSLEAALKEIRDSGLRLWSVHIQTPGFAKMSQQAHGGKHGEKLLPGGKYIALFVYPESRAEKIGQPLEKTIQRHAGKILSSELALHEWKNRFHSMRLKRLGPSVVANEVVIQLDSFAAYLKAVEGKFRGGFVFEGIMVTPDRLTMMGFMLADERKLTFPLKYSASLVATDLAKRHGGELTALGMYFTEQAREHFGKELFDRIVSHKKEADPQGLMNPGKILPPSADRHSPIKLLNSAMKMAGMSKSALCSMGNLLGNEPLPFDFGGRMPAEIGKDAFVCAQCGSCRSSCTVFDARPWESNSPRGKWYLLAEYLKGNIELEEKAADSLFCCTTCKKCDVKCQTDIPIAHHWINIRGVLGKKFENTGLAAVRENVLSSGNFWGLPNEAREWITEDVKSDIKTLESGKVGYWPGCWASIVSKNMPQNIARIMTAAGLEFVNLGEEKEACCGLYLALGGYMEDFAKVAAKNIENMKKRGIKTLVLSCPGCFATFTEHYPHVAELLGLDWDIETKHITVLLDELVREGKLKFEKPLDRKVTYHDSCHVGRWFDTYDQPRNVLKAIPGLELVEMEHTRENSLCCGLVAAFSDMGTVGHCAEARLKEALDTGADCVITNCAGCASQLNFASNLAQAPIRQKDLTDLVVEALGYEYVFDPTEPISGFMQQAGQLLSTSCMKRK
ncbi:FAD-binding oxidoreductase [Methanosarcina sp. KYL-1]|nr:FAD-binding oxidoreductase [Methanosarcina sp. KYL-1]